MHIIKEHFGIDIGTCSDSVNVIIIGADSVNMGMIAALRAKITGKNIDVISYDEAKARGMLPPQKFEIRRPPDMDFHVMDALEVLELPKIRKTFFKVAESRAQRRKKERKNKKRKK